MDLLKQRGIPYIIYTAEDWEADANAIGEFERRRKIGYPLSSPTPALSCILPLERRRISTCGTNERTMKFPGTGPRSPSSELPPVDNTTCQGVSANSSRHIRKNCSWFPYTVPRETKTSGRPSSSSKGKGGVAYSARHSKHALQIETGAHRRLRP